MNGGKRGPTLVVVLLAAVLSCWAAPLAAGASGLSGDGVASTDTTSGTWAAVATLSDVAPFGSGALSLTFPAKVTGSQYFYVANSGTLALSSITYGLAIDQNIGTVLDWCSTTWDTTRNTCPAPGKITTLINTTSSGTVTSTIVPTSVGSTVQLRVRVTKNPPTPLTATVTTEVTRSQAQAAATTNS